MLSSLKEKYVQYFSKFQELKISTTAFINPEEGSLSRTTLFFLFSLLESLPDLRFVLNGFLKGLVLWSFPFFYQRTLKSAQKALAMGMFVASYRAFFRIAKKTTLFEFTKGMNVISVPFVEVF
jgi:hypothetical protein